MRITREVFDEQRRPRFGTANPERMRFAFWEWMIRGDDTTPAGNGGKSGYDSYYARDLFQGPLNCSDGPIWTFSRMGQTRTELADGRVVCIGGEHEDWYDPDFYIYNDVVVLGPADQIEIYGYPREVFQPTDFHTASLVGERIIVVGCIGYPDDRRPGHTPVYALDLADYHISEISTTGANPGWVSKHDAGASPEGAITTPVQQNSRAYRQAHAKSSPETTGPDHPDQASSRNTQLQVPPTLRIHSGRPAPRHSPLCNIGLLPVLH